MSHTDTDHGSFGGDSLVEVIDADALFDEEGAEAAVRHTFAVMSAVAAAPLVPSPCRAPELISRMRARESVEAWYG